MAKSSEELVTRIVNYKFEGQGVVLDFHSYKGCSFKQCKMVYHGYGPVILDGCTFDDCEWIFSGPAASAISFMTTMYQYGGGAKEIIEQTIENIKRGTLPFTRKS